jgi:hypothetical protein
LHVFARSEKERPEQTHGSALPGCRCPTATKPSPPRSTHEWLRAPLPLPSASRGRGAQVERRARPCHCGFAVVEC